MSRYIFVVCFLFKLLRSYSISAQSAVSVKAQSDINASRDAGIAKINAGLAAALKITTCDATATGIVKSTASAAIQEIKNKASAAIDVIVALNQAVDQPIKDQAATTTAAINDAAQVAVTAMSGAAGTAAKC